MKIHLLVLTDKTAPSFIDIRAYQNLSSAILHARSQGHDDEQIGALLNPFGIGAAKPLRATGEITWRSLDSDEDDDNMKLILTITELQGN